jgi:hypothetical protein
MINNVILKDLVQIKNGGNENAKREGRGCTK